MKTNSNSLKNYKESLVLTEFQKQVLIGIILGDAHLETQNNKNTYRIKFAQSIAHKAYINHLYEIFKDFVITCPKYNKSNNSWYFNTISHQVFSYYGKIFYNKKKCIPENIQELLTPIGLAYWYMDDGSIKSKDSKAIILNTHNFQLNEISTLCNILFSKFDLKAWPRKQNHKNKEYYQIYISGTSYIHLRELIFSYIIPDMLYKFPKQRKNFI